MKTLKRIAAFVAATVMTAITVMAGPAGTYQGDDGTYLYATDGAIYYVNQSKAPTTSRQIDDDENTITYFDVDGNLIYNRANDAFHLNGTYYEYSDLSGMSLNWTSWSNSYGHTIDFFGGSAYPELPGSMSEKRALISGEYYTYTKSGPLVIFSDGSYAFLFSEGYGWYHTSLGTCYKMMQE